MLPRLLEPKAAQSTTADVERLNRALTAAVRTFPQLRISQIISNAVFFDRKINDIFHVSNDLLISAIERYIAADKRKGK